MQSKRNLSIVCIFSIQTVIGTKFKKISNISEIYAVSTRFIEIHWL